MKNNFLKLCLNWIRLTLYGLLFLCAMAFLAAGPFKRMGEPSIAKIELALVFLVGLLCLIDALCIWSVRVPYRRKIGRPVPPNTSKWRRRLIVQSLLGVVTLVIGFIVAYRTGI